MIRRRRSSRWSRKLIDGIVSLARPSGGSSAAASGILGLAVHFGCRTRHVLQFSRRMAGYYALRQPHGWQDFAPAAGVLGIQIIDFGFNLRLELVAGPLELVQRLADLSPDLR